MFPEHSGLYIAQRGEDVVAIKVKGVYPSIQLDKKAIVLSEYLRNGKIVEASKEMLDNMEIEHMSWEFISLDFINNFGVFSKTDFVPDGTKLYLSEEEMLSLRGKYFRLCQQGVPPLKIVRAIAYEYKLSSEQALKLVNSFDEQAGA